MRPPVQALSLPREPELLTNLDDHAVIAASLDRPDAFGELFERHELFVTAFERRSSYRAELADARPCYGIASNLAVRGRG